MKAMNLVKTAMAMLLMAMAVGCWADETDHSNDVSPPAANCPAISADVEKSIKADPELAKLDHFIDISFKTAMSLAADETEKKQIQGDQCAWQATNNQCKDFACLKASLPSRLDNLSEENFQKHRKRWYRIDDVCPEIQFMTSEADKELCLNRLFSKFNYKYSFTRITEGRDENKDQDKSTCEGLLQDIKDNNGKAKIIEPVVHTQDIHDLSLSSYAACSAYSASGRGDFEILGDSLEEHHNFRLFRFQAKRGNSTANAEWLYQENGAMKENSLIATYFTSLNLQSCLINKQWSIATNERRGLNLVISHQGNMYLFECNNAACVASLYDPVKDDFNSYQCSFNRISSGE